MAKKTLKTMKSELNSMGVRPELVDAIAKGMFGQQKTMEFIKKIGLTVGVSDPKTGTVTDVVLVPKPKPKKKKR